MKNKIAILGILTFLFVSCEKKTENLGELEGEISISGSFALYPLAIKWAEEFQKLHPNVIIDVTAGGTGKGVADALSQTADIGMVGRDVNEEEIKKGAWFVAVTKDAVIPTVNMHNPVLKEIFERGVSVEVFRKIYVSQEFTTWGQVVGNEDNTKIEVFKRSDAGGVTESWSKFLNTDQDDLKGIGVFGDPGVAEAVKKSTNGIGFNNTLYIYDVSTRKPHSGIVPLPIDVNGNGKLEANENFYSSLDSVIKAINNGNYPSPPARNLFFLTKGKPEKKLTIEFLKWTITEGQKYCKESGYISLPSTVLAEELQKF
ncbi:MAG: PstS family phosphate ABC transporter substrate-binding protein [Cytophagales bacterium]